MPLDDLSDVTRSLVRLLRLNIRRLEGIAPGDPTTITVTPEPPEAIGESAQNLLSLHCYHVAEDAYYKNLPGPGSDPPNVAKNPHGPLPLLHPHRSSRDGERPHRERADPAKTPGACPEDLSR